jgi:hypothetical protein
MQKFLFLMAIVFVMNPNAQAENSTITVTSFSRVDTIPSNQLTSFLQQMNIPSFYGKAVDSFIVAVDAIPYEMKIYGGHESREAMLNASYLWYKFSGGQIIRIYVAEFTHMNRYSPTGTWDINLFKKEKIDKIEVWRNQNLCINGTCIL